MQILNTHKLTFSGVYSSHFKDIPDNEIIIGNTLDGNITLARFKNTFDKNDLIRILEETHDFYESINDTYCRFISFMKNKLINYRRLSNKNIIKILYHYYLIVDSEDYMIIPDDLCNRIGSRLYVWFSRI